MRLRSGADDVGMEASEAECISWRKVLADERVHAQQRLEALTQKEVAG